MDDRVAVAIAAYDPIEDIMRPSPGRAHRARHLKIWIEKERRNRREDIVPPQAKVSANYVSPMMAKWAARKQGYDEILLVDEHGYVAEGPTTNVFWVDGQGGLCTPPEKHVLLGVTRRSILEIAKHDGLVVSETRVRPEELMNAAEVFLTGTSAGVWPVESIDSHAIGEGVPGPVSARLRERFQAVVSGDDPDFDHWLAYADESESGGS